MKRHLPHALLALFLFLGSSLLAARPSLAEDWSGRTPPLSLVQDHYRSMIPSVCEDLRRVVANSIRDGSDHYVRINNGECRSRSPRGAEKYLDLTITGIQCRPATEIESHQYCEYTARVVCQIIGEKRGMFTYAPKNQNACRDYEALTVSGMIRAREREGVWDFAYFQINRASWS